MSLILPLILVFNLSAEPVPDKQCTDPNDPDSKNTKIPYVPYKPVNTSADKCSPVDLRSKLPPVRDQADTGWCYAFAAADLVSAYTGMQVSPADMAIRYQNTQETQKLHRKSVKIRGKDCEVPLADAYQGGEIHEAIMMAVKSEGVCLDDQVPTDENFVDNIKKLETARRKILIEYKSDDDIFHRCQVMGAMKSLFPSQDPVKMLQYLALSKALNWQVYSEMVSKACKGKRKKLDRKIRVGNLDVDSPETAHLKKTAQQKMDTLLSNGHAVGYSSYFYFDGKYMDRKKFLNDGDSHATTVVGRKWNEKEQHCEYLVRNSYGTDCSTYDWLHPDDPTLVLNKSPYACEGGNLWIPEDELMSAMTGITWIK